MKHNKFISVCYVICCNILCGESGNITKNISKCISCKQPVKHLTLDILNDLFCFRAVHCNNRKCKMLHSTKNNKSPPYISPCFEGIFCTNQHCLFLHPNVKCKSWTKYM